MMSSWLMLFVIITICKHVQAKTNGQYLGQDKWMVFCMQHSQIKYCMYKMLYFAWNFIWYLGFSWQLIRIGFGSHNGLAPNICQAIIWTNNCLVYWHIYASLEWNQLRQAVTDRHVFIIHVDLVTCLILKFLKWTLCSEWFIVGIFVI